MSSFSVNYQEKLVIYPLTAWLLSQCSEFKGMQAMWQAVKPDVLRVLKESAIIQSAESSNRIEGVEVKRERLIPLVIGGADAQDRPEEEIVGYRNALNFIHKNYNNLPIGSQTILQLHKLAQAGMIGDAGRWKTKDNDIIEILPNGERRIRFIPVSAEKTPFAIEQLCLGYQELSDHKAIPELVLISFFILDFLCIHPFRDGNGRVSRLLTLLLLYKNGYEIGEFISLERLIEETKPQYYQVLYNSSQNWHEGKHDALPWMNYFLGIIKTAYQELKERIELSNNNSSKSSLIRQTILSQNIDFSISDISMLLQSVDRDLIKNVLKNLKEENKIELLGKGRSAKWRVARN